MPCGVAIFEDMVGSCGSAPSILDAGVAFDFFDFFFFFASPSDELLEDAAPVFLLGSRVGVSLGRSLPDDYEPNSDDFDLAKDMFDSLADFDLIEPFEFDALMTFDSCDGNKPRSSSVCNRSVLSSEFI